MHQRSPEMRLFASFLLFGLMAMNCFVTSNEGSLSLRRCNIFITTYPSALVLMSGVFKLRKPFFLTVCCAWLQLVPSPLSFCSSKSPSLSLDLLARRYSHPARPRPTKTPRAPKVPKTAVIMSRRSIPTWNIFSSNACTAEVSFHCKS